MNLYGSDYKETLPLVLLALSTIFSAVSNVIEMSAYSKDYVWSMCVINLIWAGSMIAFAAFFVGKGAGTTGLHLLCFVVIFAQNYYHKYLCQV